MSQEKYQFEDNDKNMLPRISFTKKIFYYGICILIAIIIFTSLYYGQFVLPGKRNSNMYFKGISLYILIVSGLTWIYHFGVQIFADKYHDDEMKNNLYFKQTYNTRILGVILLIISYLVSVFTLDSKGNSKFIDPKYKKEKIIY